MTRRATEIGEMELRRRRERMRQALWRNSTAIAGAIAIVVLLAATAHFQARQARQSAEEARVSAMRARNELWGSYLAQARAARLSGTQGSKQAGLDALKAAAQIRPDSRLRDEYIAHLALLDYEAHFPFLRDPTNTAARCFSQHTDRITTLSREGWIQVRTLSGGSELARWKGGSQGGAHMRYNADDSLLAVLFYDYVLRVFQPGGALLLELSDAAMFSFSPSGTRLAVQTRDTVIHLFDLGAAREIQQLRPGSMRWNCAFSPDETRLAVTAPGGLEIWDAGTAALAGRFAHESELTSVAWRGDIVAAGDARGEVRIWSLNGQQSQRLAGHQDLIAEVLFHPRRDVLVSTSYDGTTRFWDIPRGRLLLTTPKASAARFSPDGSRLGYTQANGAGVWREHAPKGYRLIPCSSGGEPNVWHVDFSADSEFLAATKAGGVEIFRVRDGARAGFQPLTNGRASFFTGTNSMLTSSAERITLWRIQWSGVAHGAAARFIEERPLDPGPFDWLEPGAVSWDRRRYVLPVSAGELAVLDLEEPYAVLRLTGANHPQMSSFSRDGRWIASGSFHGAGTRIWDAVTGRAVADLREGDNSAFFSPDGRHYLSAGAQYRFYEPGTWRLLHEVSSESGSGAPQRAAFSFDGSMAALVKEMDRLELWAPGSWQRIAMLAPPSPKVITWTAFSPDSRWLAAGVAQNGVELWDLAEIREELRAVRLDYGAEAEARAGTRETIQTAGTNALWLAPTGGVLALLCVGWIWRRQGNLLRACHELDDLAAARNRDLQAARLEILQSQKMRALGALAAGIAHDFNNLLSVIRMSNKLIARECGSVPEIQENTAEIEEAVRRGKSVVRSMLGYSREVTEPAQRFSLPGLVEDLIALLSKQFLSGIVLVLELDRDTPKIAAARDLLEQALLNLIVNASEAMNGHGSLRIRVRKEAAGPAARWVIAPREAASFLAVGVSDSGPGIPPEVLPRIFEPFFTTKHSGAAPGTGLGLHTVYTIAAREGFGIRVQSASGLGAEFEIVIPVPQDPPSESVGDSHSAPPKAGG